MDVTSLVAPELVVLGTRRVPRCRSCRHQIAAIPACKTYGRTVLRASRTTSWMARTTVPSSSSVADVRRPAVGGRRQRLCLDARDLWTTGTTVRRASGIATKTATTTAQAQTVDVAASSHAVRRAATAQSSRLARTAATQTSLTCGATAKSELQMWL